MKKLFSFCLVSLGLALLAIPSSWAATYGDGTTDVRIGYEDENCISNTEWTLLYNNCPLKNVTGIKGDLWAFHADTTYPRRAECAGPLESDANKVGVYFWEYDDATDTAECQFQWKIFGYTCLVSVTVEFKQEGKAVYAKVTKSCYNKIWNSPYGTDTTSLNDENKYVTDLSTLDKAHNRGHGQTSLHNVELIYVAEGTMMHVTFVDSNGDTLKEDDVEYGTAATAPTDIPEIEGYEFTGWDKDFSCVKDDLTIKAVYHPLYKVTFLGLNDKELLVTNVAETCSAVAPVPPEEEGYKFYEWKGSYENISGETTIKAIYHKLFTVVFKDWNGTQLDTQTVEETKAATEPDMTGKVNDKGEGFLGWDTEFDCVESDLTITALYGQKAAEVTIADETGLLTDEANALIFCGGTLDSAAWNGTTKNWATVKGVYTTWKSGATAVFATDAAVTLGEAQTVGKVIVLGEAKSVTLSGEALTFADAATVQFNAGATLKCENDLAGTAGLVVTGATDSASAALEIAGNYGITGTLTVARAFFKTVDEGTLAGGNFSQDVRIKENGVVSLGATVPQKIVAQTKIEVAKEGEGYVITEKGSQVEFSAVSSTSNIGKDWELRIAGVAKASGYSTLPVGGGRTKVLDGGELLLGSTFSYWGPNGGGDSVIVYTNGLLRLTDTDSTGVLSEFLIDGGVVTNEVAKGNGIIYKWLLKNGAVLKGYGMRVGYTDNYGKWSYIKADGDTPSTVDLDTIEIGYQKSASNNKYVGIQFQVNDVTGDDETDLYVSSPITEVDGVTYASGYRGNVGVYKAGAGTLELSSSESSCTTGVFKVEAGTVRFPAKSGGSFGALQVTGDTVIEVAASARVSFDNSSEIAWTAGKKLIFTGDMTGKSVRIGTDANALTEDQLKQVVYRKASGKEVSMSLNAEGYLQPPAKSLTIIIQ